MRCLFFNSRSPHHAMPYKAPNKKIRERARMGAMIALAKKKIKERSEAA